MWQHISMRSVCDEATMGQEVLQGKNDGNRSIFITKKVGNEPDINLVEN